MRAVTDFCNTWWREAIRFFSDWRLVGMLLVVPLLYTLLLGELYSQHRVKEVATVIQDNDRTPLSRQLVQAADATETFRIVGSVTDLQEFREMNWKGEAAVCLVIPQGLQRDVTAGKPVRVLAVVDGSNMIIANATTRAITEVVQTFSAGVSLRKWTARGVPLSHTYAYAVPIEVGLRLWYNPTFNYTHFLLIGLVGTIIQQVVLLVVALAWAKEHEEGTLAELRRLIRHPLAAALGKLLFYLMISATMSLALLAIAIGRYGVPMRGDAGVLLTATLLFLVGLVGLGMFLSSLTLSQLLSTQVLMLVALPSFLLSGFTWPLFAMPVWIQSLARILPLTHYLAVVRKTVTNGASWSPNLGEVQWLFGFAVVGVGLQLLSVWWRLRAQPVTEEETGEDYAAAARTEYAPHQA